MKRPPRKGKKQIETRDATPNEDWYRDEDGSLRVRPASPSVEAWRKINALLFELQQLDHRDQVLFEVETILAAITNDELRSMLYQEVRKRQRGSKSYQPAQEAERLAQVVEDSLRREDPLAQTARLLVAALWHYSPRLAPKLAEYDFRNAVDHVMERFRRRVSNDLRYATPDDPRRLAMYYVRDALEELGAKKKQTETWFAHSHRMKD